MIKVVFVFRSISIYLLLILCFNSNAQSSRSSTKQSVSNGQYDSLRNAYQLAIKTNDSLSIARNLLDLSTSDRYRGDYDLAFDKLWDALLITEKNNYEDLLTPTHRAIGILYDIYNKDSLALIHLNTSLRLSQEYFSEIEYKKHHIVSGYFSIANFWRSREEYHKSLAYLDSCSAVYNHKQILPYILTDRGYCNLKLGNLNEAEKHLFTSKVHLDSLQSPYMVVNSLFIGDLKKAQYQYNSALDFYNTALGLLESKQLHLELKPELLEKIAEIYIIKGNLLEAVNYLKASKQSFEQLFSATNISNRRLFEIKNKYKEQLNKNKQLIEHQHTLIEKKNKVVYRLLVLFGLTIIIGISIYLLFYQRNKIKALSLVRELDAEKNKAILDVKSKELTAHALKMIEKEEAVQSLLNTIKKTQPKDYKSLQNKYAKGSDNSWEEFNKRFTEVNTHFYESLCRMHPNLSATELKHCALIKLNFNSHEMSKVLNISLQSVHTSRYRIRKKLQLDSNSSLETYIGSI